MERCSLEEGDGVGDLLLVGVEGAGSGLEDQLELREERAEFVGVRPVELVRLADIVSLITGGLRDRRWRSGGAFKGAGDERDSSGQLRLNSVARVAGVRIRI